MKYKAKRSYDITHIIGKQFFVEFEIICASPSKKFIEINFLFLESRMLIVHLSNKIKKFTQSEVDQFFLSRLPNGLNDY